MPRPDAACHPGMTLRPGRGKSKCRCSHQQAVKMKLNIGVDEVVAALLGIHQREVRVKGISPVSLRG